MDGGAWWAVVHGVERGLGTTEGTDHTQACTQGFQQWPYWRLCYYQHCLQFFVFLVECCDSHTLNCGIREITSFVDVQLQSLE